MRPSKQPGRVSKYNKEYNAEVKEYQEKVSKQIHQKVFLDTDQGGQGEIL